MCIRIRLAGGALAIMVVAGHGTAHAGVDYPSEDFTGDRTRPGMWHVPSVAGRIPVCLTAATRTRKGSVPACLEFASGRGTPDARGHGAVRLTDNRRFDRGALFLKEPVSLRNGLRVEFDMFHYNARKRKGRGGDGISFFLLDGWRKRPKPGEPGGRLGYKGLKGALLGVGFDEYGNFSTKSRGEFSTGPGPSPNSIVVRGAGSTGYRYIRGVRSPAPLAVPAARHREDARRTVHLALTKTYRLTLSIDFHDGRGRQMIFRRLNLRKVPRQPGLPDRVGMGFAASTGTATAYHELRNFRVGSLSPDLAVDVSGPSVIRAGERGNANVKVRNTKRAGPTTGPVRLTYKAEKGVTLTAASGAGWDCGHGPRKASCTRPGAGADALRAGAAYPPMTIAFEAAGDARGALSAEARARTPGEEDRENNAAAYEIGVEPGAEPALFVEAHGDTWFPSGASGQIKVLVTNAPSAGPTREAVTATYEVMPGVEVVSASGAGWTCRVEGAKVTCTRPGRGEDALGGGQAYPPINIRVRVPDILPDTRPGPGVTTATAAPAPCDRS